MASNYQLTRMTEEIYSDSSPRRPLHQLQSGSLPLSRSTSDLKSQKAVAVVYQDLNAELEDEVGSLRKENEDNIAFVAELQRSVKTKEESIKYQEEIISGANVREETLLRDLRDVRLENTDMKARLEATERIIADLMDNETKLRQLNESQCRTLQENEHDRSELMERISELEIQIDGLTMELGSMRLNEDKLRGQLRDADDELRQRESEKRLVEGFHDTIAVLQAQLHEKSLKDELDTIHHKPSHGHLEAGSFTEISGDIAPSDLESPPTMLKDDPDHEDSSSYLDILSRDHHHTECGRSNPEDLNLDDIVYEMVMAGTGTEVERLSATTDDNISDVGNDELSQTGGALVEQAALFGELSDGCTEVKFDKFDRAPVEVVAASSAMGRDVKATRLTLKCLKWEFNWYFILLLGGFYFFLDRLCEKVFGVGLFRISKRTPDRSFC